MIYSGDLHIITILITVLIAGSAPEVQLKKRFFYLTLEEKNKSLRTVSSAGRKDVTWSVSEGVLFTLQWLQQHSFNFSNMWNVHIYIFDFLSHPSSPSTRLFMFPLQALNIYIYIFTASTHLRCMYYTTGRICTLLFMQVFALLPYPLSFLRDTIMLLRPML